MVGMVSSPVVGDGGVGGNGGTGGVYSNGGNGGVVVPPQTTGVGQTRGVPAAVMVVRVARCAQRNRAVAVPAVGPSG